MGTELERGHFKFTPHKILTEADIRRIIQEELKKPNKRLEKLERDSHPQGRLPTGKLC